MSDDVSINVSIGGRKYPLTVAKKDQEMVKAIAEDLNSTVTSLKENYAVQDRQDLLAMAALQVAVRQAASKSAVNNTSSDGDIDILSGIKKLLARSEDLVK